MLSGCGWGCGGLGGGDCGSGGGRSSSSGASLGTAWVAGEPSPASEGVPRSASGMELSGLDSSGQGEGDGVGPWMRSMVTCLLVEKPAGSDFRLQLANRS